MAQDQRSATYSLHSNGDAGSARRRLSNLSQMCPQVSNGNGEIDATIMLELVKRTGMSEAEITKCWKGFKDADKDRPRGIARNRSLGIAKDRLPGCLAASLPGRASDPNTDNSGTICEAELRTMLEAVSSCPMSDAEFERIRTTHDKDNSGTLDFIEFLEAYMHTPMQRAFHLEQKIESMARGERAEMEQKRMPIEERIKTIGVASADVKNYLIKELEEAEACMSLPGTAAILIFFALAVISHESTTQLYAVDHAITFDIEENANFAWSGLVPMENGRMGHKTIYDVNNIADFWSWVSMGLVPLFFPEGWDLNELRTNVASYCTNLQTLLRSWGWSAAEAAKWTDAQNATCSVGDFIPKRPQQFFGAPAAPGYLYYNNIVGGVRLSQERDIPTACSSMFGAEMHPGTCVPSDSMWLRPEFKDAVRTDWEATNRPGSETEYLLSNTLQQDVRKQLWDLESKIWLHPETSKVEICMATYNPHMNVVTQTFIILFFNRAGHIHKVVEPVSMWVQPYHSVWNYVFDAVWCLLVLKVFFGETLDLYKHVHILGLAKGIRGYLTPHNFVDWLGIAHGIVILGLWIHHLLLLEDLQEFLKDGNVTTRGTWTDAQTRRDFFELLDTISIASGNRRDVLALYPCVLLLRFFKAFSAQPRLALVTMTISKASVDVAHFMIVFGSVFTVFVISAQILFGQEIQEFANFLRSFNTAFHVLLGDFDWNTMKEVGRVQAAVWFWCFIWLVNLVMLNMLLAIIMDVYTEVKGTVGSDAETVVSQSQEIYRRWRERRAGKRVSLEHILINMDPGDQHTRLRRACTAREGQGGEDMITVDVLMRRVQGLNEKQACRVLMAAHVMMESDSRKSQSLAEAVIDIQNIDDRMQTLQKSIEKLIHMNEMSTSLMMSTNGRFRAAETQARLSVQMGVSPSRGSDIRESSVGLLPSVLPPDGLSTANANEELLRLSQLHTERYDRLEQKLHRLETKLSLSNVAPGSTMTLAGTPAEPYGGYCSAPTRAPALGVQKFES